MKLNVFYLTILVGVLLFPVKTPAQDSSYSIKGPEGKVNVQYLVEKTNSVMLLCRYVPDAATDGAAPYLKNVSRKARISTPDGDYALLNTIHLPVRNDADTRYAYVKDGIPALNCVLEFEKFPYDEPFDLVEEDEESSLFTARGLTVADKENVNVEDFLNATPYSEYECRYNDGVPYHTFDDPEIYLASTAWPYGDGDRYYLPVGFKIINRTKAPITVKFSDVSVRATRLNTKKKPVKCDLTVLNNIKADKEWKEVDEREVVNEVPTSAAEFVGNAAVRTALSSSSSAWETLGFLAVGMIVQAASKPKYEPYMKERNQQREELMKLYLTESTIQPGDSLSTFVSVKYFKEPASTTVSLSLNGETYDMKY